MYRQTVSEKYKTDDNNKNRITRTHTQKKSDNKITKQDNKDKDKDCEDEQLRWKGYEEHDLWR